MQTLGKLGLANIDRLILMLEIFDDCSLRNRTINVALPFHRPF